MSTILENILEQVDGDGWDNEILSGISPFHSDTNIAIQKVDNGFTKVNTIHKLVITTKGWEVQVQRADQSTEWISLSMIKESI